MKGQTDEMVELDMFAEIPEPEIFWSKNGCPDCGGRQWVAWRTKDGAPIHANRPAWVDWPAAINHGDRWTVDECLNCSLTVTA